MSVVAEPVVELHDGHLLPRLGFGVFQIPNADTPRVVSEALEVGYRHIDAAAAYGNEAEVGRAVRSSGLGRDTIAVTTKLPNTCHGYEPARRACHASLERLDIGPIDLYLIHWPLPMLDLYVETWRALVNLQQEGVVRSVGVSNFTANHLDRIIAETGVVPVANQVELHPGFQQSQLREHHARLGIVTEAWSPLGRGKALTGPEINRIAATYGRTPSQILIRWSLQLGNVVLVKTTTRERMEANRSVLDFELSAETLAELTHFDAGRRMGPDPDTGWDGVGSSR